MENRPYGLVRRPGCLTPRYIIDFRNHGEADITEMAKQDGTIPFVGRSMHGMGVVTEVRV